MKRTPLARGTSRLAQGKPLSRNGYMAQRSTKRADEYARPGGRRDLVVALLAQYPRCQIRWACRGARSVDVHERLKRSRGGKILDPDQAHMVTACRACHDLTEREVAEATWRRMLLPSWHQCPPAGPC